MIDIVLVGDLNSITKHCIRSIESTCDNANIIVEPFQGYNKSLNNGAAKGNNEFIAFCNNDLEFLPNWDKPLIKGLNFNFSVSPWCPRTHKDWWGRYEPVSMYRSYEVGKALAGWFIMMRRDSFERLGGFDERLEFWASDNSYAEQLKAIKKSNPNFISDHALIPQSKVIHFQSQTLNKLDRRKYKQFTSDQITKFEKLYNTKLKFNARGRR